jgi:hypothetical protein
MIGDTSFGYTTRLRVIILLLTFLVFVQFCLYIVNEWNAPNMLYDISKRGDTWIYWRLFSHPFGLLGLMAMFWLVTHLLVGAAYLLALITTALFGAWHILLLIFMIDDWVDCASTSWCSYCLGCAGPDWAFLIHFFTVGAIAIIYVLFVVLISYLRTRVEFANYLAIAADSRYNPLVTYMTTPGSLSSFPAWMGGSSSGYSTVPSANQISSELSAPTTSNTVPSVRLSGAVMRSSVADSLLKMQ